MDVSESVDPSACKMGGGGHQSLMLGTEGEFISEGGAMDMRPKGRMFGDILHTFPVIIDIMMKVLETPDVIFFRDDSFHWFLLLNI